MNSEILYHTANGTAIYKGEPKPTNRELHKAPESYSIKELNNMSEAKRRQLAKEFGD